MNNEHVDPSLIRQDWIPRFRLMSNVLVQLERRRTYTQTITTLIPTSPPEATSALELERLSRTWMLVDNLLGVYTVIAKQLNLRIPEHRINVSKQLRDEPVPPTRDYLERIWLFPTLREGITSGGIKPKDITPTDYLAKLEPLIDRTIQRLSQRYTDYRTFHQRYEPIAMAHRHGRAIFHLHVTKTDKQGTTNITIDRSTTTLTAIRSPDKPGKPTAIVELVIDTDYEEEIAAIHKTLKADIHNITVFISALEATLPTFLAVIEHRATGTIRPPLPYLLLAEPNTEEEQRIASNFLQGH